MSPPREEIEAMPAGVEGQNFNGPLHGNEPTLQSLLDGQSAWRDALDVCEAKRRLADHSDTRISADVLRKELNL